MAEDIDWDALTDAGLLDLDAADVHQRKALLTFLIGEGCTVDELVAADSRGRLFALGGDRIVRPGRNKYTLTEVAAATGGDEALVRRLWRAFGLAGWDGDMAIASEADLSVIRWALAAEPVLGEHILLEVARATASALSRIGEATNAAGRAASPIGTLTTSGDEIRTATFWTSRAHFVAAFGGILDALYRHHYEAARDHFERSGSFDIMGRKLTRLAVGFLDMTGFTVASQSLDEVEFAHLVASFAAAVGEVVSDRGGRVVKFIGDAAMVVAPTPDVLAEIAVELVSAPPGVMSGLSIHAGLAHGELLSQDGDYFGTLVNIAARLAALADPGTVLVTSSFGESVTDADLQVDWMEPRVVRGFTEPMATCVIRRGVPK